MTLLEENKVKYLNELGGRKIFIKQDTKNKYH